MTVETAILIYLLGVIGTFVFNVSILVYVTSCRIIIRNAILWFISCLSGLDIQPYILGSLAGIL